MYKTALLFFYILLNMKNINGQSNLVNNASFEDTLICPYSLDQANFSTGWSSYRGSPDYFNSCANNSSSVSIPFNCWGFQNASSGHAYMGLKTFFTTNYREFFGSELISPLII